MARKVSFSEADARRIAASVRAHERGNRDAPPIRFRNVSDDGGAPIRLCKTTADWASGTTATLNVWEEGSTPGETQSTGQTVTATNKMHAVASGAWVHVAQAANGVWYLIEAGDTESAGCNPPTIAGRDLTKLPGYDATKTQALVHESGCMQWLTAEDCPA